MITIFSHFHISCLRYKSLFIFVKIIKVDRSSGLNILFGSLNELCLSVWSLVADEPFLSSSMFSFSFFFFFLVSRSLWGCQVNSVPAHITDCNFFIYSCEVASNEAPLAFSHHCM